MRIEETRRFPIPRQQVYDYLADPNTWPLWLAGMLDIKDAAATTWDKPGDRVHFTYKLLGRRIESEVHLQEIIPTQYVGVHITTPAIGDLALECFYSDAGEHSTTLRLVCQTAEPTIFFGRPIDRSVVPQAIQQELIATLSNLKTIFALGLNDESPVEPPRESGGAAGPDAGCEETDGTEVPT